MANEIKILRLDDRTLEALTLFSKTLNDFRKDIEPILDILKDSPRLLIAEFTDEEVTAFIDGEEYINE